MENRQITAREGMMLTDGHCYTKTVYVSRLDSIDNWREVPMSEYEAWLAAQEAEADAIKEQQQSLITDN